MVCVKWNHLTWKVRRFCRKANCQRRGRRIGARFGQGRRGKETALLLSRSLALGHRLPFRTAWVMVTGLHEGCWEGPSGHRSVRL